MRGASLSWVVVVLWCGCDPDRVVDVGDPRRLIISAPRVMLDDGSQVDVRATLEGTQGEGTVTLSSSAGSLTPEEGTTEGLRFVSRFSCLKESDARCDGKVVLTARWENQESTATVFVQHAARGDAGAGDAGAGDAGPGDGGHVEVDAGSFDGGVLDGVFLVGHLVGGSPNLLGRSLGGGSSAFVLPSGVRAVRLRDGRPLYLRNGAVFEGQPDPLQAVFGSPGDNDLQHDTACSPVDWIAPSPDGRWAYACGVGEVFEGTARLASAGWLATMAPDGVWLGGEVNVQMSNSFVPYRALRVAPQGGLYVLVWGYSDSRFHLEYQSTRSRTGVPVGTYAELPGEPNPLATDYDRVLLASDLSVYAASARTGTVWRLPLEPGVASVVYAQSAVPADIAHDVLNVAVDNRATLITTP